MSFWNLIVMNPDVIKEWIEQQLPGAEVQVTGDGHHFEASIIAEQFIGKSLIQQHRMVYDILQGSIVSGELHAISLKTFPKNDF